MCGLFVSCVRDHTVLVEQGAFSSVCRGGACVFGIFVFGTAHVLLSGQHRFQG